MVTPVNTTTTQTITEPRSTLYLSLKVDNVSNFVKALIEKVKSCRAFTSEEKKTIILAFYLFLF